MAKIKLGSKLSGMAQGIAGFMDFKKAFDKAQQEMAWEKEKLMFGRETALMGKSMDEERLTRTALIKAGYLTPTFEREGTAPTPEQFGQEQTPEQQAQITNIGAMLAGGAGPRTRQLMGGSPIRIDRKAFERAKTEFEKRPTKMGWKIGAGKKTTPDRGKSILNLQRLANMTSTPNLPSGLESDLSKWIAQERKKIYQSYGEDISGEDVQSLVEEYASADKDRQREIEEELTSLGYDLGFE